MKLVTLITASFLTISAFAATKGSPDNPVYRQCVVELPDGQQAGVCKEDGGKYFKFYTCEGHQIAFIEPGALSTVYIATCGPNYKGFPQ